MIFRPLTTKNSDEANLAQINDMMREVSKRDEIQIFKDDTGTRRVLLGKGKNGFYGLKVSEEGVDVWDATDAQLIFNSDQNVFKIVDEGTTSLGSDGSPVQTVEITHNLGFAPIPHVFLNGVTLSGIGSGLNIPLPAFENLNIDLVGNVVQDRSRYIATADSTKLYITLLNATGAVIDPLNIKYYLLQESAN